MLLAAAITGGVMLARPAPTKTDLTVWTFTEMHARMFRGQGDPTEPSLIDQFHQQTGGSVSVKLIGGQAINVRLNGIFDNGDSADDVPDLVEIEISSVGRFFRPPVDEVGFLPLNDRLKASGWDRRLLASRMAPWTKQGVVFGIPSDVHPVSLTYRRDLFEQAGVDLPSATTWPAFQTACLAFQTYWTAHGHPRRRAIELPSNAADYLVCMLLQRHLNLLDSDNTSHLTDPRVADTVAFYARCIAGPRAIAGDASPGANNWIRDLADGDLCCIVTPDWRSGYIRRGAPDLAFKLAMMPLPKFDPADSPTATWGGTMMAIPKQARDPDKSWRLLQFLYLSPQSMHLRPRFGGTIPPVISAWNDPIWHQPDPFYGGQKIGELYVNLARELPERYVTPFTTLATQALTIVLDRAITAVASGDDADLTAQINGWLKEADGEVRKRIEFGRFDK
jgi:arabinosaccharide transport system substrate-binding protein